MKKYLKPMLILLLSGLIVIIVLIVIQVQTQERDISFEYYGTFPNVVDEKLYNIERAYSGIVDDENLRLAINKEDKLNFNKLDFSEEAYLMATGKPIERMYYKLADTIKIYSETGHVLYIEYGKSELSQQKYVYIFDNSKGPYCTEDEKIQFMD